MEYVAAPQVPDICGRPAEKQAMAVDAPRPCMQTSRLGDAARGAIHSQEVRHEHHAHRLLVGCCLTCVCWITP
jgi:hypothetical protein